MPSSVWGAALQLLLALVASGVMLKLLTIRQDRRKIVGDATVQEANAASTLSGAALQMVERAEKTARDASSEAKDCRSQNERLWTELNKARWRIHFLEVRESVLESALRMAGIDVPSAPEQLKDDIPAHDPPPNKAGTDGPSFDY